MSAGAAVLDPRPDPRPEVHLRLFVMGNAPNSLAALFQIDDELGTGWSQLGLLAGVTAAALIAAYALLEKRDV